jgi:hypothetical protein
MAMRPGKVQIHEGHKMSRRKDRERFNRLKEQDSSYRGFRGINVASTPTPVELGSVTCSVCQRKRNVPVDTIPEDPSTFICVRCQEQQTLSQTDATE